MLVQGGPFHPYNIYLTSNSTVTTTSSTFSTITSMSTTPVAGNYLIIFTGTLRVATTNADGEFALFKDSTQITESTRRVHLNITTVLGIIGNAMGSWGTPMAKVSVDGSNVISAQFRSTSGTIACDNRSMFLMAIS